MTTSSFAHQVTTISTLDSLHSSRVIILGLGREGLSSYHFLRSRWPSLPLILADQLNFSDLPASLQAELSQDQFLTLQLGSQYLAILTSLDETALIIKTPGLPASLSQVQQALAQGARLSSNLQLFLELIAEQKKNKPISADLPNLQLPIVIGVTGTKGKSTTSSLIHHILSAQGKKSILVGNIGEPALSYADKIGQMEVIVIEMSSHQLAQLTISPDISVIQAITSEHLDYYRSVKEYIQAKEAITKYQNIKQYVIYSPIESNSAKIAALSPGIKLQFAIEPESHQLSNDIQVYLKDHYLMFRDGSMEKPIVRRDQLSLLGFHNLKNIAPSIIIGQLFGLTDKQIAQSLASFTPLPHRLEKVDEINQVLYVNDSMATMPDASISALTCFGDRPIILLAGGHERQQDFAPLAKQILKSRVKAIALFPANGQRLWEEISKLFSIDHSVPIAHQIVNSMSAAFAFVNQYVQPGDVVLLSPGAASFGVFKDYADRGEQFRRQVTMQQAASHS